MYILKIVSLYKSCFICNKKQCVNNFLYKLGYQLFIIIVILHVYFIHGCSIMLNIILE